MPLIRLKITSVATPQTIASRTPGSPAPSRTIRRQSPADQIHGQSSSGSRARKNHTGRPWAKELAIRPALWVQSTASRYSAPPVRIAGTSQIPTSTSPSPTALATRSSAGRQASPAQSGAASAAGSRCTRITGPLAKAPNASAAPRPIQARGPPATSARIPSTTASVSIASNMVSPA